MKLSRAENVTPFRIFARRLGSCCHTTLIDQESLINAWHFYCEFMLYVAARQDDLRETVECTRALFTVNIQVGGAE